MLRSSACISLECSQISPGFGELEPRPYQAFKESMLKKWFRRAGTTAPLYLVIEFHHTTPGTIMNHSRQTIRDSHTISACNIMRYHLQVLYAELAFCIK